MKDTNRQDARRSAIALLLTLLLTIATVWVMFNSWLHYEYPPKDMVETELLQDTIMFGGEYVMLGNTPEATAGDMSSQAPAELEQQVEPQPQVEAEDLHDNGEAVRDPKPVVTSTKPSPMKVQEKPKKEKTGPAVDRRAQDDKAEKARLAKEAATDNKVKGAFAQSASGKGSGKQGQPDGNSDTGAVSGAPSIGGLQGYTLEYFPRERVPEAGTVVVQVHVNTRGNVTQARVVGGSGKAVGDARTKAKCVDLAKRSRFSVPRNTTTEGIGTLTYVIR